MVLTALGTADNVIRGLDGDDVINGGGGDDSLFGNDGDDIIRGSGGNDIALSGDGDDSLNGGGIPTPVGRTSVWRLATRSAAGVSKLPSSCRL